MANSTRSTATTDRPDMRVSSIPIQGMDCGSCAETIAVALRGEPGVEEADVSFGSGKARVSWDPETTSLSVLEERITGLGFDVSRAEHGSLRFSIEGMDCGSCAESVERAVSRLPGVAGASVNFASATLTITRAPGHQDALSEAIRGAVDRAGFVATPHESGSGQAHTAASFWHDQRLRPALLGAVLWLAGFALDQAGGYPLISTALFFIAIAVAGRGAARAAWQALRVRHLDMNVLMTSAVIGAALLGEWSEGAMVVVLFSLGGSLQALTIDRTRSAIRSLMTLAPDRASRLEDGQEVVVPVESLAPGDLLRVKPGERIATDGEIVEGVSTLDQRAITGESLPVDSGPGDTVFAGAVNGGGSLIVRVTAPASSSAIARIIHLVEEAQASRAPSQELVDRFAAVYTPLVLAAAIALTAVGSLITSDPSTWFYRALVLLVIACPCALVISTPVAIVSAIGALSRLGVLVKGGAALEAAGSVRAIAFDKTGTLTIGRPSVTRVIPVGPYSEADVLSLAASIEARSEHPLGRAIVAKALHDNLPLLDAREFSALPGRGATGYVDGHWITVGSGRLAGEQGALDTGGVLAAEYDRLAGEGGTPLLVMSSPLGPNHKVSVVGLIGVADIPRRGAKEALQRLLKAGVEHLVILTGDAPAVAAAVGQAVGIDEVRSNLLPEDKVSAITELRRRHGAIAMVGDGINDAPALAAADVGIAMGTAGTAVALETADFALMRDDLNGVASAMALSRRTTRIIRQNIGVSLAIKFLALVLGTAGYVDLWLAVVADMGTSLAVTANGLRLLRVGQNVRPEASIWQGREVTLEGL
jgi:Cd2+/Zn2+-exporting ATPase